MKSVSAVALSCLLAGASAATWQVISNDLASVINGVAFLDDKTGFVPAGANGVGAEILKTSDGGASWHRCPREGGFLMLNAGGIGSDILVSGALGEEYSDNTGGTFNSSSNGIQAQCVRTDGASNTFWVVGEELFGGGNGTFCFACNSSLQTDGRSGVSVSTDGGKNLKMYDAKLFTDARYGSFPTADVWYVSAGEWPENQRSFVDVEGNQVFHLTEKIQLKTSPEGKTSHNMLKPGSTAPQGPAQYKAQISKSTDGGKTWTTVFGQQNSTFYFNGTHVHTTLL